MSLKLARRKFLGALAASPLAAKAASEQAAARMMGSMAVDGIGAGGAPLLGTSSSHAEWERRTLAAAAHLKAFGVPAHVEAELRERARHVYALDPDLAVKRSWSLSVKIATQRQRNYERMRAELEKMGWRVTSRQKFKALTGFEWPL